MPFSCQLAYLRLAILKFPPMALSHSTLLQGYSFVNGLFQDPFGQYTRAEIGKIAAAHNDHKDSIQRP